MTLILLWLFACQVAQRWNGSQSTVQGGEQCDESLRHKEQQHRLTRTNPLKQQPGEREAQGHAAKRKEAEDALHAPLQMVWDRDQAIAGLD